MTQDHGAGLVIHDLLILTVIAADLDKTTLRLIHTQLFSFNLKLLRSDARRLIRLLADRACIPGRNPPARLLTALRLRTGEPAIPAGRTPKPALPPLQLTRLPLLHLIDFLNCMLLAIGAIMLDLPRNLHSYHELLLISIHRNKEVIYKNDR